MYKKMLILIIPMLFIFTGCTKVDNNIDNVIDDILRNKKSVNTVSTKYELYIPIGVKQFKDNEYNQVFKIKNSYVYMYVDIISYYYKNELNYSIKENFNYYYKKIQNGKKTGFIGIKKINENNYFCEIVYNYSKIEFFTDLNNLSFILTNSLIIQDSIKYNDELIRIEFLNNLNDGKKKKYQLDKPDDSKSTFSKYLQEYVAEDDEEVKPNNDN